MNTNVIQVPIFSVVVIAHDRKEYLLDALKSISRQTLPKEFFEVIIVKNFVDREIDDYANASNFELVLTEAVPVGAKMSIGIEKSKGEYIAFLEDDDLFEESKLVRLNELIRDRKIGFVHNSFELIDTEGNVMTSVSKETSVSFRRGESFVETCIKFGLKSEDIVLSSCMMVSKAIIIEHLKELSKIEAAPDLFILMAFIASPYSGIHTRDRLTKYRLHQSQSNRVGDEIDLIRKNLDIRRNWVSDYTVMRKIFCSGEANELAEYFFRYNSLFTLILKDERSPLKKGDTIIHLIKSPRLFQYYPSFNLILLALLSILSPRLSHKEYYRYRKIRYVSTFT